MVIILDRVKARHPEVSYREIREAWKARIKTQYRVGKDKSYLVSVDMSSSGKLLELIAFEDDQNVVIFHVMKANESVLRELGLK